jgi:hypothetical protein
LSGWIKLEKDLLTDPRVIRMGTKICNGLPLRGVTVVLGSLAHLWMIADTHIGQDDVIPLGANEINDVIGVEGFCQLLPSDWLEIIDPDHVKLPGFHTHNGTIAKERAQNAKRVQRHRINNAQPLRLRNGLPLPDQDQDLDKTKTESKSKTRARNAPRGTETESEIHEHIESIKAKYPKAARSDWITAEKLIRNLVLAGTFWELIEAGVERYAAYCTATNRLVQNPGLFFGAVDRPWLQDWELPKSKAEARLDSNVDVMRQFVAGGT